MTNNSGKRRVDTISSICLVGLLVLVLGSCIPIPEPCLKRLDQETLDGLRITSESIVQISPGGSRQLTLEVMECCVFFTEVEACVDWSIEPQEGASIDTHGNLRVDPATPAGTVYTVRAVIEQGRRLIETEVHVYSAESNPLVGIWRERSQLTCQQFDEVLPPDPIQELKFLANGTFNLTWQPFEVYVDYWGDYRHDLETGDLQMQIESGNYIPADHDLNGRFSLDAQGFLWLHDLWLGSREGETLCGHVFAR